MCFIARLTQTLTLVQGARARSMLLIGLVFIVYFWFLSLF